MIGSKEEYQHTTIKWKRPHSRERWTERRTKPTKKQQQKHEKRRKINGLAIGKLLLLSMRERERDTERTEQSARNVMLTQTIKFASSTEQMCTYRTHTAYYTATGLLTLSLCRSLSLFHGKAQYSPGGNEQARTRERASGVCCSCVYEENALLCIEYDIVSRAMTPYFERYMPKPRVPYSQHTVFQKYVVDTYKPSFLRTVYTYISV